MYKTRNSDSSDFYIECAGKNCPVKVVFNVETKIARFSGKHSDHPTMTHEIHLIELNRLLRARSHDHFYHSLKIPTNHNDHHYHRQYQKQCVPAEIKNILLRDGHQKRALLNMRRIRKKFQKLIKMKQKGRENQNRTQPNTTKQLTGKNSISDNDFNTDNATHANKLLMRRIRSRQLLSK